MGSFVPWEHRSVFLRRESADRLFEIQRAVHRVVDRRFPPAASGKEDKRRERKRERARRNAERRVLDIVIGQILQATSTIPKTRELFDLVMKELPRLHNLPGSYLDFDTGLKEWRDLEFQFS